MREPLADLEREHRIALPPELHALVNALPDGGDLGGVRLLSAGEIASGIPPARLLSPALILFAVDDAWVDGFALFAPPEPGSHPRAVCAVDLATGVYAPVACTVRGWGALVLLLRSALGGTGGEAARDVESVLEQTAAPASALAHALALQGLLGAAVAPDSVSIADLLATVEPASPWAGSIRARREPPAAGLRRLAPALAAVPFAAGLLEQAAGMLLACKERKRALRSLAAALSRYEPNLQTATYRVEEPDPESGAFFEPFDALSAFRLLREHEADLPRELRQSAPLAFLRSREEPGFRIEAADAVEDARSRSLGGDRPGGRWVLHFAFGALREDPKARALLAGELAREWEQAGSRRYAARFAQIASEPGPGGE